MPTTITQGDVFTRVRLRIHDTGGVRWPDATLNEHLHAALVYIAVHKPSVMASKVIVDLQAGALQVLPDNYVALVRAVRNMGAGGEAGAAITAVNRVTLDASSPGWSDPLMYQADPVVEHLVEDPQEPRDFYVFPPNDGTGRIEALVTEFPAPLSINPAGLLPLADIHVNAVVALTAHYALLQDSHHPGQMERANAALNEARSLLGLKMVAERTRTRSTYDAGERA